MAVDISESSWKAFIKKQKLEGQLEDKDLLKALARFDKTDERKPEPRLEALADLIKEVPKQVTALVKLKKKLGDKPFGLVKDELYAILDEAEKLQKKTQAALDAEAKDAKAGKEDEGGEDDEPGSALLDPKRLVAQLKMCQRTPDRKVQFAYLDPASKDQPAVLAMHPKMSSTSLFNKLKKETAGKTGAYGSAWLDGTSLILQLDKPLGGLVKKVRAAVKATGFRVAKVVLWNADGTVFEQDDEPDNDGDAPGAGAAPGATTGAPGAAPGPAAKSIPPAPPGGPAAKAATPAPAAASPEAAAFMTRLKALLAKAAEFGDPALAQQAKLLGSEAGVALRKGESAKVEQLMTQAEALFATARPIPPAPPGGPAAKAATPAPAPASPEAAAFTARLKTLLDKAAEFGDPALAQQAKLLGSEAGVALRKGESAKVDQLMKQAEALFANAKAAPATPAAQPATETARTAAPKSDEELAAAWQARFETTEKVYLEVMERPPGDAAKLRALMDFANGKAKDKQYASAAQTLDRLDGMLAKVLAATTPRAGEASGERGYKGLVAYRTSLLEFRTAVAKVNGQIASLKAAIPSQMPEESDLADELSSELSGLTKSFLDAVDEAMNTSENVESPITDAMLGRLIAYGDGLETSELVEHVDNNPFGVSMSVRATLMASLANIQAKWPVKY